MNEKLVPIAIFWHAPEAHIAKSFLAAYGVPCTIFDEHTFATHWHLNNALGGIRLMVPRFAYEEAKTLLENNKDIELDLLDLQPQAAAKPTILDHIISFGALLLSGMVLPWHKRKKHSPK